MSTKTKITLIVLTVLILMLGALQVAPMLCAGNQNTTEQALKLSKEATKPHFRMLFAGNVNVISRIGMDIKSAFGDTPNSCINTATSFYNPYNTCSSCEDFVANPGKWSFYKVDKPKPGDILVYQYGDDKWHAGIITSTNPLRMNHAVKKDYRTNSKPSKHNYMYFRHIEVENTDK